MASRRDNYAHSDDELNAELDEGQALIQQIEAGATVEQIKELLERGSPLWCQDGEGQSALHAAVYREDADLVELLLEKGAVWNAVDFLGNTAGDIALTLNNELCYRLIRDAGIRSEYLLSHLSAKVLQSQSASTLILRSEDSTAAGSSEVFLNSRLKFSKDANGQEICLVQAGDEEVGVMMGWERGIMQETVNALCNDMPDDLNVLNVGFGLGIIDSMFQSLAMPPARHFIIEAHPDVLQYMREQGWYNKAGVTILEGKWQDLVGSEQIAAVGAFDVVYTDTFSESYQDLYEFFEHVPELLAGPHARFSFFNGLGATNALFYDVYTQLAELHLSNIGLNVTWSDVDIVGDGAKADVWGQTRKYFGARLYRMPIAQMSVMDTSAD